MSDFEGSDLTDLEDETWTQNPSSSQKKKKQTDGDGYRIRGALKAPRSTTISARHLLESLHENDIDLDAEYQRDVVWPVTKQMGLIDSMFRNFYIPPVIFSVNEASDGSVKKVCIDGKQRLTSIWRFMEGLIPHKDPFTNEKYFFKDIPDRKEKGKLLPERYRKIFENKQIVCMEYADLTDSNEREVFQRVQLGMALTPAEKLQAIHSDAGVFLHSLQSEYVSERLAQHLDWDIARAADFRCLSTAVYLIDKGGTMAAPGISTIHKWLEEADAFPDATAEGLHQTFQIFVWLSEDKQCSKCFNLEKERKKLKVSPLEFVASAVLIHSHKSKLTLKQLSEAIRNMRNDVRSVEQDIRLNTRCVRIVMTFIKGLKASSLKPDHDNPVATVAIKKLFKPKPKLDEDSDEEDETQPAKKAIVKRKREDSDDEWKPQKSTPSQRTTRQTPIKRSPPPSLDLNGRAESPRTQPAYSSSLPPRPPSPRHPAPPIASSSLPPPPPESRVHPDRLAALRSAKIGIPVPVYQSPYSNGQPGPNDPPHHAPNSPYAPYPPRWQDQPPMRLGPMTPVSDAGPSPYGSESHAPTHSTQRSASYGRDDYDRDRGYSRYPNSRFSR